PERKKYVDKGFHNVQFNFRLDPTRMGELFQGESPSRNKGTLKVTDTANGLPVTELPEMPNEYSRDIDDMDFYDHIADPLNYV
ncbi:manganese catalase family protein, partial [Bacillus anthracis]|nr:manganese catalase family protein [Bacillus anthracis]